MKTNIALIGFMGVGKTEVGKALAVKLNREFVELDSLIEQKTGKSISQIFEQDGEIIFRELEIEAIKKVSQRENTVIACGGGVVLNKINIDRLREEGRIVYLTASPDVVLKRISRGGEKRPLVNVSNRTLTVRELLKFRRPFYEGAADITVNTSNLNVNSVVECIINRLKDDEGFNL